MTYVDTVKRAIERSLNPDYRGCGVYVCAVVGFVQGVPAITDFMLSDWFDGTVLCTIMNGKITDKR